MNTLVNTFLGNDLVAILSHVSLTKCPLVVSKCHTMLLNDHTLTSGSAMMMRILRSDSSVKLANRLLRTNSPGLLSGSTLTGAMVTGPFLSPGVPLTGGRGGFSPTGEAVGDRMGQRDRSGTHLMNLHRS